MRFWISRGIGLKDYVFFERSRPKDDGQVLSFVCYAEFTRFTGIRLKRGESLEFRTGKRFMWRKKE